MKRINDMPQKISQYHCQNWKIPAIFNYSIIIINMDDVQEIIEDFSNNVLDFTSDLRILLKSIVQQNTNLTKKTACNINEVL